MKNQIEIVTNIQSPDEKKHYLEDTNIQQINNFNEIASQVKITKENPRESTNDKSFIEKNSLYNNLSSILKDQFSEEKNDNKKNINIPNDNNFIQILKESFSNNNNFNEQNKNLNLLNNENELETKNKCIFDSSRSDNIGVPGEYNINSMDFYNKLISSNNEKEDFEKNKNVNLLDILQILSSMGNINIENFNPSYLNNLLNLSSNVNTVKEEENQPNQNLLESFINQINYSRINGENKKEEKIDEIKNDDSHVNSKFHKKELHNTSLNGNFTNNEKIDIDVQEGDRRADNFYNKSLFQTNEIDNKNKINLTNLQSENPNYLSNYSQQKLELSNIPTKISNNEEFNSNFNFLDFLLNQGNISNFDNNKLINGNKFHQSLPNSNFQSGNNLNLNQILSNQPNNISIPILNQNMNLLKNEENVAKIESINSLTPTNTKGSFNFHINLHFNVNLIQPVNNHSLNLANTADIRKNSNDHSLSEKSKLNKDEYNTNNQIVDSNTFVIENQTYTNEIEKICNKYNNKIIESENKNNKNIAVNVANFNNLVNKYISNPNPKFNDFLYYLNLFNTPDWNSNLFNFFKNNFDVNKISEEYKNLIFNETTMVNPPSVDAKKANINDSNAFANNMNNASNLPFNLEQLNNLSNLIYSILGNNSLNNGNQTGLYNLSLSDQLNLLQNPIALQQLQSLFNNQEIQKSENFGIMSSIYNMANSNNLNNLNDLNLKNCFANNDGLNNIRNNSLFLYNTADKDLINDLNNFNNFNRIKNNNINNLNNSTLNSYNQNKTSVFLSNKIKRQNSNHSESGENKNYKSFKSEGRYCDSNYGSNNNNYDELNDIEENYYKNKGYVNMSQEGKNNTVMQRKNDDLYDFLKSKKFHIKKFNKSEQALNNLNPANNVPNLTVTNFPNNDGNLNNNLNLSNLCLPENKSNKENRKFKADSIHKKIKVNVLKYLKSTICEFIPNKKVNNLSQEIITNVNISFNKELLQKQLFKIYEDDYLENDSLDCLENIKKIMCENREFFELMNLTLKDFIIYKYWKSEFHKKKLSKIFQQESYEYYVNYEYLDKEFINYFLSNKGNKRKILKNKKDASNDEKSEYSATPSNNPSKL